MTRKHQVVIVGGGFGGLHAAKGLRKAPVQLTILDRRNFHLFQPLLYQVATGGLSPGDITSPIRRCVRKAENTAVLLEEVVGIDAEQRIVHTRGPAIHYDTLILAAGASHHYFGNDSWGNFAPGLKTIEDATHIRGRILGAFEAAEKEKDPGIRASWLTFVVVGAGPTGVELAGALGELANDTLKNDFRQINPRDARIILVEGRDQVLPAYPAKLARAAERSLARLGVTVRLSSVVKSVSATEVVLARGDAEERVPTRCVLWAAGVQASPIAQMVHEATGVELDRAGRIVIEPDLTVPGHPEIIAIGDMVNYSHQTGAPLPGVAPVAMQQGRYAARLVRSRLAGRTVRPFRYRDKGSLATIGRSAAVADFGRLRFSGWPAWVMWLGIHLAFLIEFENRVLVLIQWAWSYFTRNRGARLIAPPLEEKKS